MCAILAGDNGGMRRWILAALLAAPAAAADLKPQTLDAFDRYVHQAAQRLENRPDFIWSAPGKGDLVVAPVGANPVSKVPGGLVHDWVGVVFLPGVTVDREMALAQDYNRHKDIYKPEVLDSRILSRDGNHFRIY